MAVDNNKSMTCARFGPELRKLCKKTPNGCAQFSTLNFAQDAWMSLAASATRSNNVPPGRIWHLLPKRRKRPRDLNAVVDHRTLHWQEYFRILYAPVFSPLNLQSNTS